MDNEIYQKITYGEMVQNEYLVKDLSFDKGNGASFSIAHDGQFIRCYVAQDNAFLAHKSGRNFPDKFDRYSHMIYLAAIKNIENNGVSTDILGNLITEEDLNASAQIHR